MNFNFSHFKLVLFAEPENQNRYACLMHLIAICVMHSVCTKWLFYQILNEAENEFENHLYYLLIDVNAI